MDSLKTLLQKEQYDLVIKLTENSNDPDSLIDCVIALVAVGQFEKALDIIKNKRDVLKKQLELLIKLHIEILCLLNRFDEAFEELEYYKELPYESQLVEEALLSMPAYIRNAERASYGPKPQVEEELNKRLLSDNEDEVLGALDEIKSQPIERYLPNVLSLIKSHPRQVIRTFGLLLLLKEKYDKEVEFLKGDKLVKVVPVSLPEPFVVPGFKDVNAIGLALQKEFHDPTVVQNALQTLSSYLLYIYPDEFKLKKNETIIVFGYIAKHLLQIDTSDLEATCEEKKLDYAKTEQLIKDILEELNNF